MRLRHSKARLKRLQLMLTQAGHLPGDSYRKAKLDAFWQQLQIDKRLARGEI